MKKLIAIVLGVVALSGFAGTLYYLYSKSEDKPVVFETALSDFYVEYELVAYGAVSVPRPVVMSGMHEQILDALTSRASRS